MSSWRSHSNLSQDHLVRAAKQYHQHQMVMSSYVRIIHLHDYCTVLASAPVCIACTLVFCCFIGAPIPPPRSPDNILTRSEMYVSGKCHTAYMFHSLEFSFHASPPLGVRYHTDTRTNLYTQF